MSSQHCTESKSRSLSYIDPMNTSDKQHYCFNLYDRESADLAQRLEAGATLKDALAGEFKECDYDGESLPVSESVVESTMEWLEQEAFA